VKKGSRVGGTAHSPQKDMKYFLITRVSREVKSRSRNEDESHSEDGKKKKRHLTPRNGQAIYPVSRPEGTHEGS